MSDFINKIKRYKKDNFKKINKMIVIDFHSSDPQTS